MTGIYGSFVLVTPAQSAISDLADENAITWTHRRFASDARSDGDDIYDNY